MSAEFISRIFGMFFFAVVGIQVGIENADVFNTFPPDVTTFIFALVGMLVGLVVTPYLTVRPVQLVRRAMNEVSADVLLVSVVGLAIGLVLALLLSYPVSLLGEPFGTLIPPLAAVVFGYLGMSIFGVRAREFLEIFMSSSSRSYNADGGRELLMDTSVLIDGRIVEIAQTGFLGGVMLIPRFVLSELHQVADSADSLRRNRGRRGLTKLNELQRDPTIDVEIVDDDVPEIREVDDKLVAVALQRDAAIVTNDFNLNQVAEAQGVMVLNINELSNVMRAVYIPGEEFALHVFQEGKEDRQGVGYLEDGTMVIVENGERHMDRTINVEVTKLINRPAGRMIFAKPAENSNR